jgi:hypothetical protein
MLFLTRSCFCRFTRRCFFATRGASFLSLRRSHMTRPRSLSRRRRHMTRSRSLSRRRGYVTRTRSLSRRRSYVPRTWFTSFGVARTSGAAMESFLPTGTLATMVLLIKFLVIMMTLSVSTPIRILLLKTPPVLRLPLIPRQPSRSIPGLGSDNIVRGIGVIRGPAVLRAEKIIQQAI